MRAMIIGPEERAAAASLVAYAMEPEHWYRAFAAQSQVPGDNPAFVLKIPQGYRCVFTITEHENQLWRHLTVSVDSSDYPHPVALVAIARLFGFTGGEDLPLSEIGELRSTYGWQIGLCHPGEHCIVVAQPFELAGFNADQGVKDGVE